MDRDREAGCCFLCRRRVLKPRVIGNKNCRCPFGAQSLRFRAEPSDDVAVGGSPARGAKAEGVARGHSSASSRTRAWQLHTRRLSSPRRRLGSGSCQVRFTSAGGTVRAPHASRRQEPQNIDLLPSVAQRSEPTCMHLQARVSSAETPLTRRKQSSLQPPLATKVIKERGARPELLLKY